MTYEDIKRLAAQAGRRVTDLIALAPQNDPFYVGKPAEGEWARWFAALYRAFGYERGWTRLRQQIHLRRMHYQIVSQEIPVPLPNGTPYVNTEGCWDLLGRASKCARYLGLVDPAAIEDRRNPPARRYVFGDTDPPEVHVDGWMWAGYLGLPAFPDLPTYRLKGYSAAVQQRYYTELWCEKSTMDDVLVPLCLKYGTTLQTGLGELSISATRDLAARLAEVGKPARVLYISDFDPAGQSMPVAVARKLEYFVRKEDSALDVRLFPVVLTAAQVQEYRLPRTPIKDSELRRAGFEERYGEGATELDAMEALHPGALRRVLEDALLHYFDDTLGERTAAQERLLDGALEQVRQTVLAEHEESLDALRTQWARVRAEWRARIGDLGLRIDREWQAVRDEMEARAPDVAADYPVPEAAVGQELGEALYDSRRSYLEQLAAYKAFQGKDWEPPEEDEEEQ